MDSRFFFSFKSSSLDKFWQYGKRGWGFFLKDEVAEFNSWTLLRTCREREREQQQVKRIPHLCTHTRLLVGELQRTFFRTTKSDPGCIQVPNDWTKGVKSNIFHSQFWYVLAAFTQTCHISVWFEGEGKRSSEWENVNNMSAVIVGGRATKCQQGDRTSYRTDNTFPQKPHCPVCLEILHTLEYDITGIIHR